jgi:O-antigen/teichoic acid export membrane protein
VLGFGVYSCGVSLINVLYNLAPQLFLARILDFASVGLYSRAVSITQVFDRLVTQVLNPVVMPAIVARRSAGDDLKRVYLESVELLSAVQWPALVFVALMAQPIILIWLGRNWLEIVPLVRLLCIANMALFAACLSYPVLVAAGGVRDALVSSLVAVPPSLFLLLCASFFGVEAVAASTLLTLPFQAAVAFHYIGRRLGAAPRDLFRALAKSAVVTAVTAGGLGAAILVADAREVGPVAGLVSACFVGAMCWLFGLAVTSHPLLSQLIQSVGAIAVRAPWLRPKRSSP